MELPSLNIKRLIFSYIYANGTSQPKKAKKIIRKKIPYIFGNYAFYL